MSRADQDYEELQLYLQQAKEEIGLTLDRHDTGAGMDTTQTRTMQNYANRSSGTWDLNIEETRNIVTEQLEETTTSLKVSYDVTFQHDVSLEHDVIIPDADGNGTDSGATSSKPEIKLNELLSKDIDEVIDLYDNVEFYNNEVNRNRIYETKEEIFLKKCVEKYHTFKETTEKEVLSSKIKRNISDSYLEVADTVHHHDHHERNENSNSFEDVVLKLKGFLNERFKGDESRSEADSSDEYLTAETDFDSMPRYSDRYGRHKVVTRHPRKEKIGYISSSENDSYLSDISNLDSDFSDCRSLTSEQVKTSLLSSSESKRDTVIDLEHHKLLAAQENVFRERQVGAHVNSNFNPSHTESFKDLNSEINDTVFELCEHLQEITKAGTDLDECSTPEVLNQVAKKLETEQVKTLDTNVDYQEDVEKSLQRELDKFNHQINEIENSARPSSLCSSDFIDRGIRTDQINNGLLVDTFRTGSDEHFVESPNLHTGLEDVESLLKRSLNEFSRSLTEEVEQEIIINGSDSVFEWDSVTDKETSREIDQKQSNVNKYFAVLGISSVDQTSQAGRKKGRSLSNPEVPVLNWKFSPENEENMPTEMVVGPYASMSNSYNENWNSSVFVEQNILLKQRLEDDHLHNSKEKFEKLSVDLVSSNSESNSVSRSKEVSDSLINKYLVVGSPAVDSMSSRPCQRMNLTKELDPSPFMIQPQVIAHAEKMNKESTNIFSHPPNDLDPPAISESLDRKERITLDKIMKHPVTPPPPSVNSTELLISDTLNRHRELGSGIIENSHEPQHFRKNENFRGKSADFAASSENGLDDIIIDSNLNRKSGSVIEDLKKCGAISNAFQKNQDQLYMDNNKENVDSMKSIKHKNKGHSKHDENRNFKSYPEKVPDVNKNKEESTTSEKGLPSCNGIHVPRYATISTNTSDSLKRIPKIQIKAPSLNVDDMIPNHVKNADVDYGLFSDITKKDKIENTVQHSKIGQDQSKDIYRQVAKKVPFAKVENKPVIKALEHDVSPEMQVMINSLSPVLQRRNTGKKMNRKIGNDSSESSPEIEKKKHTGSQQTMLDPHLLVSEKGRNASTEDKPSESLFMDPKMTQTWHGATSANWSQIYGPQMREMMRQLNDENSDDVNAALADKHFEEGSKTLPSSKSLLDQMHKRLCADQYIHNLTETEMARALVLLRMKSNKPVRMDRLGVPTSKRSASFHIKMGTAGTPGSSESSPMLPRWSERKHIKTSPRMQYPTKPSRITREKTPEPLLLSKDLKQNEGPRKEDAEIEAVEACRWLKETGFPQYAQMYEDGQFPVDIDSVEKDHDFLDKEDIQSLFRRLNTLNKCAIMKIGTPTKKESEDSEDEDQCALSDKWKYQRSSRRWSRKDLYSPVLENRNGETPLKSSSSHDSLLADQNSSSETGDSPVLDTKMHHTTSDDMMLNRKHLTVDANGNATMKLSPKIRRAASERIKSAKSFLKRVESLKGRRRKPKNISDISGPVVTDNADMQAKIKHLNCKEINSTNKLQTVLPSDSEVESRLHPNLDISANSSSLSTPERKTPFSSPSNESVTINSLDRTGDSSAFLSANSTFSDNDTSNSVNIPSDGALGFTPISRQNQSNNSSLDNTFLSADYKPGRFPKVLDESIFSTSDTNIRTRSFSYIEDASEHSVDKVRRRGSCDPRNQLHRVSIYDNVPIEEDLSVAQQELDIILSELFQNINGLNRAINGEDAEVLHPPSFSALDNSNISVEAEGTESEHAFDTISDTRDTVSDTRDNEVTSGTLSSPDISDHELHTEDLSHDDSAEHIECRERRDSGVGSSLTRTNSDRRRYRIRWHSFQKSHRPNSDNRNLQLCNLSAGQILILRKLSLLKLTALLEKYSPNRSGWSLTVPRFMKRNKVPDYKDKNVFGVPFTVMIQRTGQALPQCILHAMRFLRKTSRDALGIFRKSGVRSRIQKLRNEIEANPEVIDFEELQAYDVADLVKQYFRELPECLLTNKLSDIFISIFIYVPAELRLEAMQAAIVLMVDEHRDVLQSLMLFLSDISQYASEHQMTASNLAVCFGPSLFNMGGFRHPNQTPSPRRNRKNPGIPDARELMEQKAAHECLTMMIQECKKLFTIPAGTLSKCRCWHGDPVSLDELNHGTGEGDNQGYTSYIDSCIQGLLKESRDKFRGWVSVPVNSDVDVSYKKVGDGHPLRLWKCTIDVEAPPNEVLNRVLNERQVWDEDLLQWNSIEKLDKQTEVFQFVRNSLAPHPTRDFCVLRSWRSDLPKGACVLISTSIDHPRAELLGGIRAVELASRYLIEPCGTGKSRLSHISRVDIRGHSSDWYKKVWGHICANFMEKIRSSFNKKAEGPETKV